jgi:deazaflavin-dependent oxidoreductase (nitroreductase family)
MPSHKREQCSPNDRNPVNATTVPRYLEPDWMTRHVLNPVIRALVRAGISLRGARELHVQGRSTGEWHKIPVNLLTHDGTTYLVAPRGTTQWVRNLRASGTGRLRIGRRVDVFNAVELADDDKPALLRAYLKLWAFEVGKFFEGVDANSPETRIREIAGGFPVFRITLTPTSLRRSEDVGVAARP